MDFYIGNAKGSGGNAGKVGMNTNNPGISASTGPANEGMAGSNMGAAPSLYPAYPVMSDSNLSNNMQQAGTIPQSSMMPQSGTIPQPSTTTQPSTAPQSYTMPQYDMMPQPYTMPESYAMPQQYTIPESYAMPQPYTMPQCDMMPQQYTIPESYAMPQPYTMPQYDMMPQSYTMPSCDKKPKACNTTQGYMGYSDPPAGNAMSPEMQQFMEQGYLMAPNCFGGDAQKYADILMEYINDEYRDHMYYTILSRRAPTNNARRIFRSIAGDEMKHARRWAAAYFLITGKRYFPTRSMVEPVSVPSNYNTALRDRYIAESSDAVKYRQFAAGTTDRCLKRMATDTSDDERQHAQDILGLIQKM